MDDYDFDYGNYGAPSDNWGNSFDDEMPFQPGPRNMNGPNNFRPVNQRNRRGEGYGRFGPPMFGPQYGGPPPLFQSPPLWGRGFGPKGPPQQRPTNRPLKFLIRCGVPKEHLKGLPRVLLELMEPEYCGLCAHELDSFAVSRMHYVSKNHLKNQKKWLAHHNEAGPRRVSEVPLKSRDLYCELCDVHITSKAHADSHYAGKSHRSIVEGRRKSKNPILLQRGMQDRLDQLIRREKRHLNPVEESEATEETKKSDTKLFSPELYCEICQATVTCSEQMTMHLNGKRHLTKEKQHILKMMKGEKKEETVDPEQDSVDQDANGDGNGDLALNIVKEEDDWVNGGDGNWDDVPQQ